MLKKATRVSALLLNIICCLAIMATDSYSQMSFIVVGDSPYEDIEYDFISRDLRQLPKESKFIIHLGDLWDTDSKGFDRSCPESYRRDVSTLFREAPVPVFFIPGDQEFNKCASPKLAMDRWRKNFVGYENHWDHTIPVKRQKRRMENFSFVLDNVLFVGINLVGPPIHNAKEWQLRQKDDLEWIRKSLSDAGDTIKALILFAHTFSGDGDPSDNYNYCGRPIQEEEMKDQIAYREFAKGFTRVAKDFKKPILYLQGQQHCWTVDQPFLEAQNITRVIVDRIDKTPMLKIDITNDPNGTFVLRRRLSEKIDWYRKDAENGSVYAMYQHGMYYFDLEDYDNVIKWLTKAEAQGSLLAQAQLGSMYYEGLGLPNDFKKALDRTMKAVGREHQKERTQQKPKNSIFHDNKSYLERFTSGVKTLEKKAKTASQFYLGAMHYFGTGTQVDYKESLKWFLKAAKENHGNSFLNIAQFYFYGQGVKQDYKEALKWLHKARAEGVWQAKLNIGMMHQKGLGVPKDEKQAVKWFRDAAAMNSAMGQFYLGLAYYSGSGVERNVDQAVKWTSKAAMNKHSDAIEFLQVICKQIRDFKDKNPSFQFSKEVENTCQKK